MVVFHPQKEIKLLAEAAGMSKDDVIELLENPPDSPNDVEEAILSLAAELLESQMGGVSFDRQVG